MKIPIKIALGQMTVVGGDINANLTRAERWIEASSRKNCDVIVLPECLDCGWMDSSVINHAQSVPGPLSDRLCAVASRAGIYVVAGLTEREGEKFFNTSILISSSGEILLRHRKINVTAVEQSLYSVGDSLQVATTPFGAVGITICLDNAHTSAALGHSLARMGAQLILSPCSWAMPATHDLALQPYHDIGNWKAAYTDLAQLYDMSVVGVSNVGTIRSGEWSGHVCVGSSLAVGPGGMILLEGPTGQNAEQLLFTESLIYPSIAIDQGYAKALSEQGYIGP